MVLSTRAGGAGPNPHPRASPPACARHASGGSGAHGLSACARHRWSRHRLPCCSPRIVGHAAKLINQTGQPIEAEADNDAFLSDLDALDEELDNVRLLGGELLL